MRRAAIGLLVSLGLPALVAPAETRYVSPTGGHSPPYTNWVDAATNIQDAIDACASNDCVLVADGSYDTGGRVVNGMLTNRIALTNAIRVMSVNGPAFTIVVGQGDGESGTNNGDGAVRCAYVGDGCELVGFTLTNGHTRTGGDAEGSGGGAWCEGSGSLSNCILTGNSAFYAGGGVGHGTLYRCTLQANSSFYFGGGAHESLLHACELRGNTAGANGGGSRLCTLYNCVLTDNSAGYGGGSDQDTLYNCTLCGNRAFLGGGLRFSTAQNCIIYYNAAPTGPNWHQGTFSFCCTTPRPEGEGHRTDEPGIRSVDAPLLLGDSPCREAGTNQAWMSTDTDLEGEPRLNGIADLGADECWDGGLTGSLSVAISAVYTQACPGYALEFRGMVVGRASGYTWSFDDGAMATNRFTVAHAFGATGTYWVSLAASNLTTNAVASLRVDVVQAPDLFVAISGDDGQPGTTWTSAKATIQAAVDAATIVGQTIWVSNGVYDTGGRPVAGTLTNRVALDKPVSVRSVNGPRFTTIVGRGSTLDSTNHGDGAVRCAFIGAGSLLDGFTLTNGHTLISVDNALASGGGAWCDDGSLVTNCVLTDNAAYLYGGGAYRGTLVGCTIIRNGALAGAGVCESTVWNSELRDGSASDWGGGAYASTLYNCALVGNIARRWGGGSCQSTLENCTLTANAAGSSGGGSFLDILRNCIVYYNAAIQFANVWEPALASHSCITPLTPGPGNIDSAPGLLSLRNPRLLPGSPCADAGEVLGWMGAVPDLDGEPRRHGAPDIGADELWPVGLTGAVAVAVSAPFTQAYAGVEIPLEALVEGHATGAAWEFGDSQTTSGLGAVWHAFAATGRYAIVLSVSNLGTLASATTTIEIVADRDLYVAPSGNDAQSGQDWSQAKATIQAAVDAATILGQFVWVTNGVYDAGGRVATFRGTDVGTISNRVSIDRPIRVSSVNGPTATCLVGHGDVTLGGSNGPGAMRCAFVGDGAQLIGFTLTNGHTATAIGSLFDTTGGGALGSLLGVLSNCHMVGNVAEIHGGGVCGGVLNNCILASNSIQGGGTSSSGGGAYLSTLRHCTLSGNRAYQGGGSSESTLQDCLVQGNVAAGGGGSYRDTLSGCLLNANRAGSNGGGYGGGANFSTLTLCTLSSNLAELGGGAYGGTLTRCQLYANTATNGGGSHSASLYSCILHANEAGGGGGAYDSELHGCTLSTNRATATGGGCHASTLENCIVFFNQAPLGANAYGSSLAYTCAPEAPAGAGNITNEPQFEAASSVLFDLSAQSPCIDAGRNASWTSNSLDVAGRPRQLGGATDMGAQEFRFEATLRGLLGGALTGTGLAMRIQDPPHESPYKSGRRETGGLPTNAVDWVQVQVRESPTSSPAASVSALLLADGRMVDADGGSNVWVEAKGLQYAVLQHRNHLSVMSAQPVFTNRVVTFDFSSDSALLWGGTNAAVEVAPGVWAMRPGDPDGDGEISAADQLLWQTQTAP